MSDGDIDKIVNSILKNPKEMCITCWAILMIPYMIVFTLCLCYTLKLHVSQNLLKTVEVALVILQRATNHLVSLFAAIGSHNLHLAGTLAVEV